MNKEIKWQWISKKEIKKREQKMFDLLRRVSNKTKKHKNEEGKKDETGFCVGLTGSAKINKVLIKENDFWDIDIQLFIQKDLNANFRKIIQELISEELETSQEKEFKFHKVEDRTSVIRVNLYSDKKCSKINEFFDIALIKSAKQMIKK